MLLCFNQPYLYIILRKELINIQNIEDTECLKCLVRYLHLVNHDPPSIRKIDKYFARELDFKEHFLSKLEICTKLEKMIVSALRFLVMKVVISIQSTYQKYF